MAGDNARQSELQPSVDDGKFREIAGGGVRNPEHDQGAIVVGGDPCAAMGVGGLQDLLGNQAGGVFLRQAGKKRAQTLRAEFLKRGIFRFENTVGSENNNVTRLQFDGGLVVLGVGNQAERDALEADDLHLTVTDQEGVGAASVGQGELARRGVKDCEQHGNESRFEPRAEQALIQKGEHASRFAGVLGDKFPDRADRQGAVKSCGGAFAGNIAEREAQAALSVGKEVIKISAEVASRDVGSREIETGHFAGAGGKELALDFPGAVHFVPEPPFTLPRLFVEARVLERDGNVRAQGDEHTLVLCSEGVRDGAFQIENADEPVLQEKRNNEFGASFHAAFAANVAGIIGDVIDAEDAALAGSSPGEALMKRELRASRDGILVAHGKSTLEELSLFIPEHDAEDVIIDDFLDALGHAAQEFFAVQNGGELAAHLVEEQEGLGLFRMRGEKTLRHRIGIAEKGKSSKFRDVFHDLSRSENIPCLM